MLSRIFIQNFALIQSLEIDLQQGLQVITGETGAGKSIILGALRLILGERADLKSVQDSAQKSIVETEFHIAPDLEPFFEENDLDFDVHTVIRREILPTGKSRAFVNDVPVTLEILKSLASRLIDIHSQFETSGLFQADYQFGILDGLAANKVLLLKYQADFAKFQHDLKNLSQLEAELLNGNKEHDYFSFLLNELDEENLDEVDMTDLQHQLQRQENADAITENLSAVFTKIDQEEIGVLDQMLDINSRLTKIGGLSHEFTLFQQRFEENFVEFKDILFDLQNSAEKIEIDPELIHSLSQKVNRINTLLQKHQVKTLEELRAVRDEIRAKQTGFDNLEEEIASLKTKIEKAEKNLSLQAEVLSKNRRKAVPKLIRKTEDLLKKLGLEKAKIDVELAPAGEFSKFGKEEIQFLFQANAGFPLKPIQSAISGGERSRVMLSMKKLMAENADLPTLILDEIDTGVSGKVAEEMGNVMREMAEDMQLIIITHLAQVAAKGDNNYKVIKEEIEGKTQSNIIPLQKEEKLTEIAQLLSGSKITEAALQQARELMK